MSNPQNSNGELISIAKQIADDITSSDDHLLTAAALLAKTRARFKAGEFPDTSWAAWSAGLTGLGKSRVRELVTIGASDDPRAALAKQRRANKDRQDRHHGMVANQVGRPARRLFDDPAPASSPADGPPPEARCAAATPPLHNGADRLKRWVDQASEDEIQRVLDFIQRL